MILFHTSFKKAYRKRSRMVRERFDTRLKIFENNPFNPILRNHALQGKWLGYRSINVTGDFRAVFKQKGEASVFVDLNSHANLYKS